jgi:hypothetical protein
MPTVTPTFVSANIQAQDTKRVDWTGIITGDTIVSFGIPAKVGAVGAVQIDGTFGGATVTLQASNDNATFFQMKDVNNTNISATSAGYFEFRTGAMYIRPVVTGGSANSINVKVALRG